MLFCQHPLCLNAKSRKPPLERSNGQRLAARPCSPFSFVVRYGVESRLRLCLAGLGNQTVGKTGNHFRPRLWNMFAVAGSSAVRYRDRSNLGLWIFLLLVSVVRILIASSIASWCSASLSKWTIAGDIFSLANVRRQVSPLAFGADPASAGCVTKVPKAWGLTAPPCSHIFSLADLRGLTYPLPSNVEPSR